MLRAAGFASERWSPRIPDQFAPLGGLLPDRRMDLSVPEFRISDLPVRAILEFLTVQFLVVARPGPATEGDLAIPEEDPEEPYTLSITPSTTGPGPSGKSQEGSR
jgi:hypothetical protein